MLIASFLATVSVEESCARKVSVALTPRLTRHITEKETPATRKDCNASHERKRYVTAHAWSNSEIRNPKSEFRSHQGGINNEGYITL